MHYCAATWSQKNTEFAVWNRCLEIITLHTHTACDVFKEAVTKVTARFHQREIIIKNEKLLSTAIIAETEKLSIFDEM